MCLLPKAPSVQQQPAALPALPPQVKPIEPAAIMAPPKAPPAPSRTAQYLGTTETAPRVTASPTPAQGFNSLRIRRTTGSSTTGLNVPRA